VVERLLKDGVKFNPSNQLFAEECSLIHVHGNPPLQGLTAEKHVPSIIVLHGGDDYTRAYAKHSRVYDQIVAVSTDSLHALEEAERARAVVINNGIDINEASKPNFDKRQIAAMYNLPYNRKWLLFLGRISAEKEPAFFVDVVNSLSSEWIGIMVGPQYFQLQASSMSRTYKIGKVEKPTDMIFASDALLLASKSEGGPRTLVES